jgi:hypothetical protein
LRGGGAEALIDGALPLKFDGYRSIKARPSQT